MYSSISKREKEKKEKINKLIKLGRCIIKEKIKASS